MSQLNSQALREKIPKKEEIDKLKRRPIFIIVDNVLDTFNIGSIFRLADAMAVERVYLCQGSDTPPNPRITKASVNTWHWVKWEYKKTAIEAIKSLPPNSQIVAIEQTKSSLPYTKIKWKFPLALIVGHETTGVSKSALKRADRVVEIPLYGVNKSLNVVIALGIILYKILESRPGSLDNI